MRRFTLACIATLGIALAVAIAPVARATPGTPPVDPSPVRQIDHSAVQSARGAAYWTPTRMRSAVPRHTAKAATVRSQQQSQPPTAPQRVVRAAPVRAGGAWTGGGAVVRTTGKVFFTEGGRDYVCSGSVVPAANDSTVITAGHCVKHGTGAFVRNFVFVPGYHDGRAPYGVWRARRLSTTYEWAASGNLAYDVGFAVVAPRGGWYLEQRVGSQSIGFNQPRRQRVYAFGYPEAPPYNGSTLDYCSAVAAPDSWGDSSDRSLRCDLTGGASGGPWLTDFNTTRGTGVLISLNSFGYSNQPDVMYGPYLGSAVEAAYEVAQAA